MIIKDGKRIDGLGDSMPIGSIVELVGTDIPDGWEEVIEPADATIYVGSNEPMDGQDIWMQKGKNLFDINSTYTDGLIVQNNTVITPSSEGNAGYSLYSKKFVVDGPMTLSATIQGGNGYARFLLVPMDINNNIFTNLSIEGYTYNQYYNGYWKDLTDGYYSYTINLPEGVSYLQLGFVHIPASFTNIQLEYGTVATEYEPYVDDQLYIKTADEVYRNLAQAKSQILWQNRYPNSAVSTMDIKLSSYDFDFYEIIFKQYYQNPYYQSSGLIPKGCGANLMSMSIVSTASVGGYYHRVVRYDSSGTLTVYQCQAVQTYTNGTIAISEDNTTMCIPVMVIGYTLS